MTTSEFRTATVLRTAPLTPSVLRVTFTVPGFASTGLPDEWVHIFFGAPGDHQRRRNYTVRAVRPGDEVDVDFIMHEGGLAATWARTAAPGQELVWGEVTGSYAPPADTAWRLLVGDLTALPAMGRIVEELPAGARAYVVAEVADPADRQTWETAGDVEIRWLESPLTASRLEEVMRTFPEPKGEGYRWMAGETRTVRATRRHLRHERGLPKERYSLTGYWLIGLEKWMTTYNEHARELSALWEEGTAAGRDEEELMDAYEAALERVGL